MIIPVLRWILRYHQAPITWLLVFINALFYIGYPLNLDDKTYLDNTLKDDHFLSTQGVLYAQFIKDNESLFSKTLSQLSDLSLAGKKDKSMLLGGLALRNPSFMSQAENYAFVGDQVQVAWWLEKFLKVRDAQANHPSYVLGISSERLDFGRWISYQFVHSGSLHFFSNMFFLLIFGCMLEPLIGGLALAIIYLGTGIIAAGCFLLITQATATPLIGASGAISGIMGLFCFLFWKRPVRYFYTLFIMKPQYWGYIYLPAWFTLILWGFSDFAGYLSTMDELGGIAYTAHIGGQLSGLLVGASVFFLRYFKNEKLIDSSKLPPTQPMGTREELPWLQMFVHH